jgi:hypothetical protein
LDFLAGLSLEVADLSPAVAWSSAAAFGVLDFFVDFFVVSELEVSLELGCV